MTKGEILERYGLYDVEYQIEATNGLPDGLWRVSFSSAGHPVLHMINRTPLANELRAFGHVAIADQIDAAVLKAARYSRAA